MESPVNEILDSIIYTLASDLNYSIYKSSISFQGERSKIYVRIDNPGGISHKDCEIFTRELSMRLNQEKIVPVYTLEVSSPGLQRELKNIEEFRRFKGSQVKITYEMDGKNTVFKGLIDNVIDTIIEFKSDKANISNISIDINNIIKANLKL